GVGGGPGGALGRRAGAGRRDRRVRPDRPRAEGPGVGDERRRARRHPSTRRGGHRGAPSSGPAVKVSVRAPATVANLGPGFDCLALALDLWNGFTVDTEAEPGVEVHGEGAEQLADPGANL